MSPVNWDQFRDGDRIRVTIEGTWHQRVMESDDRPPFAHLELAPGSILTEGGSLAYVTSAELISRPFTPPAAGTLFRHRHSDGRLFQALSENRFMLIRWADGTPANGSTYYTWAESDQAWRDAIEVLDI